MTARLRFHHRAVLTLAIASTLVGVGPASRAQPSESRSVWEGVYTVEQADRGEAAYIEECARCHGSSLSGTEVGPALVGDGFVEGWTGMSVSTLFKLIHLTMPQDSARRLTPRTTLDVVAFILQENQFPHGETAFDPDFDVLSRIRIEKKPVPQE